MLMSTAGYPSVDGERFVGEVHGASLCKVSCSVTIPSEDPFCRQQSLHTHGAPGVNARSTNTNFRSCTKSVCC
jgi:hypothetical protein